MTDITPPLTSISIETISKCNRRCDNCPNYDNVRPNGKLSVRLYEKILGDLAQIDFVGTITFSLFNEPLLDKRLPEFIDLARKKLPATFIYLNSNGDLLNGAVWENLRDKGLDFLNVTQYDADPKKELVALQASLVGEDKKAFSMYPFIKENAINRAGLVELEKKVALPLNQSCSRPFYQMAINYQGLAVLCCNDYFGDVDLGDLRNMSVKEIWEGEKINNYRNHLERRERGLLKLCAKCDMPDKPKNEQILRGLQKEKQ